jgi:DNA-binding NarL/FixJ family response regulator
VLPAAAVPISYIMAGRPIQILVVEADPVMRLGLVTYLGRFSDLQVVLEADPSPSTLRLLREQMDTAAIDLVVLGLSAHPREQQLSPLDFCQQVRIAYPPLPMLLLANPLDPDLQEFRAMGIEGCCLRGGSILELVEYLRQTAAGAKQWAPEILGQPPLYGSALAASPGRTRPNSVMNRLIQGICANSIEQIETALTQVDDALANPKMSLLDRSVLNGRRRELNAANWIFRKLLPIAPPPPIVTPLPLIQKSRSPVKSGAITTGITAETTPKDLQAILLDRVVAKLQFNLDNLTSKPLEIDLLKVEKKRELCYLILRQFEGLLDELRFSQITSAQLPEKQAMIWPDLWASVTTDFFGRYYQVSTTDGQEEIVPRLLQDRAVVQTEILAKIPQKIELLNYLLFQRPLDIDNMTYAADTQIAMDRACDLLENLTIELANATIQPLLNYFGNSDAIKFSFFDRRLLSTREIERFRNDLSWRYRVDRYFNEPQSIFESKYRLLVFTDYGIKCITIYASRPQELAALSGIPLAVTLALETRDALAPRLQSATKFIGSAVVYLLTEVIGRGIGLIGRGVIKGIGNIWQESNRHRQE